MAAVAVTAVHHDAGVARIDLFPTCVVDALSPEVGVATVRLLRGRGHVVGLAEGSTCCGQPAWNSGHADEAATVARTTLDALEASDADVIVVPAGSCTTMIRVFWPELFEVVGDHDAADRAKRVGERVRELSELLTDDRFSAGDSTVTVESRPEDVGAAVVYHRSCHMLRELRIVDEPERLLDDAGVDRREPTTTGRCCGFGGLFTVKLPELSQAMADEVLDAYAATGADTVVGCDTSCLIQLRGRAEHRGIDLDFEHLAQTLLSREIVGGSGPGAIE